MVSVHEAFGGHDVILAFSGKSFKGDYREELTDAKSIAWIRFASNYGL